MRPTTPLLLLALLLPACTNSRATDNSPPTPAPTLHHIVLFDLKDPAEAPAILADSQQIKNIPGVATVTDGIPLDTNRPNTITDYDAAIIITFTTTESYRGYADHPIHKQLITKWRDRWNSIRIIDIASEH